MSVLAKSLDYILCEGASDSRFISLYLCKKFGFSYNPDETRKFNPLTKNGFYIYLSSENRDLLIISCDGCSNIDNYFVDVVKPLFTNRGIDSRIWIVIDRDKKNDGECLDLISECRSHLNVLVNQWESGTISGGFTKQDGSKTLVKYKVFFAVIPSDKPGAFETILLKAALNSEPDIYNCVNSFFNHLPIEAKKYIDKPRKELKAFLDVILILMDPETLFGNLESLFNLIDFNDSEIQKNYMFLNDVLSAF